MLETIKQVALNAVESTKPAAFFVRTITSVNPLTIVFDQKITLDASRLIVPESLTKRKVKLEIEVETEETSRHKHLVRVKEAMLDGSLKTGDKVLLVREQGGQRYIIIDRVVTDDTN